MRFNRLQKHFFTWDVRTPNNCSAFRRKVVEKRLSRNSYLFTHFFNRHFFVALLYHQTKNGLFDGLARLFFFTLAQTTGLRRMFWFCFLWFHCFFIPFFIASCVGSFFSCWRFRFWQKLYLLHSRFRFLRRHLCFLHSRLYLCVRALTICLNGDKYATHAISFKFILTI